MPTPGFCVRRNQIRWTFGLLCAALAGTAPALGADWPGFMGPRADGVSPETGVITPGRDRLELGWKRPLGSGYSAIAVAGGRAVTIFSDGKSDVIIALATVDGREQWRYPIEETYKGHDGSLDGPLSTPLIADGKVFALSARGKLVALDAAGGKEVWKVDLVAEHGAAKPHYGFTTSPLLAGGVLIVQGAGKGVAVAGFDPLTGKRLWAAGEDAVNYQSPIPFAQGDRAAVLATGDTKLICVDPKTGEVLWQQAYDGKGERGAPCMVPVPLDAARLFLKHQDDRSKLVEVATGGSGVELKSLWEEPSIGKSYTVAVHHQGYLYGFNNRTLACVDTKTGKTAWRSREPGDGSVIVVDGHLVVMTKDGGIHIAKPNSQRYEEVSGLKLFEGLCWSAPSFADGSLFVRSMGEIARVDLRSGGAAASVKSAEDADLAGTRLGKLLEELRAVEDKSTVIDHFLAAGHEFPLIESDGRVVFVYRGAGEDVVVGGDLTGFGSKLLMRRVEGTDLFYAVTRLEPDARVNYGFVRDYKSMTDPLNPRKAGAAGFDEDLELKFDFTTPVEMSWISMPEWKPPKHIDPPDGSRRGKIESHTVKSEALGADVAIDVYLPAGYDKAADPLPVLYVHDGKLARGDLRLVETLDNLVGREVSPLVAVFIMHQAPFFGPQDAYAKMAAVELPAFVDGKYRTVGAREGRAHFGCSFAGAAAMYAALAHADSVGKLGVQAPFTTGPAFITPVMKKAAEAPMTVYLDWCKYDLRSDLEGWSMAKTARELDAYFREHGYKPLGGEAHDGSGVSSWQNRTDDALTALFPIAQGR